MNFTHIDQEKFQEKLIDVLLHAATRDDVKYEINKLDIRMAEFGTELKATESKLENQINNVESRLDKRIGAVESKLENLYKMGWVILATSILIPLITKYLLH